MEIAQKHKDQLKRIKKNIERSFTYFKANNERYHKFQKFTFNTSLSADDEATLKAMGKPVIEFNITNAPISRLCGEFSKQEPSIYVSSEDNEQIDHEMIQVIEGHIRHILFEAQKTNVQYNVYRNQLSGGFSNFKVWTEYAHEMSMDQVIRFGATYDPTMTGYDPMAREVDKSDAQYCFEIFPMTKEEFKAAHADVDIKDIKFTRQSDNFNWSYSCDNEDILVIVDYYERKKKSKTIVKLVDANAVPPQLAQEWLNAGFEIGGVMELKDYKEKVGNWELQGFAAQAPAIVGKPRNTVIERIVRYRLIESEIIEYVQTPYKYMPLIFVDGDSIILKQGSSSTMQQFTKPYTYHTEGLQRLTNFSGQVIANDFENMVMHKFKVAEESLPTEEAFRDAYTDYQTPNTLVYKALWPENPMIQLPPPQEIVRVPLPQEVTQTFNNSMSMLQNILGSYDASLGINNNQLSGVAIVEGATQSNAAAMPYVVNYMHALNQVANNILDLMPKIYKTPRTIPVVTKEGHLAYQKINQVGQPSFSYDSNILNVKVQAGVNFSISKNQAMQQITALMQASPIFAQFINTEGLDVLLDNVEFRGIDIIKSKADQFMQKIQVQQQQMQQQQMQQMQQQANPEQLKMQMAQMQQQLSQQKLQQDERRLQSDQLINAQKMAIEKQKADNEHLKILLQAKQEKDQMHVDIVKAHAEDMRAEAQMHIDAFATGHEVGHKTRVHLDSLTEKGDQDGRI